MALIGGRYAPQRRVRATLYGAILVCEDRAPQPHAAVVVLKQISLRRAVELLETPNDPHHAPQQLDDPREERAVARRLELPGGGHANVVRHLADFVDGEQLYLVLEHCAGGDLYELASQQPHQRLACAAALGVVAQVAAALRFLHSEGIAHRDVSLENVLLTADGTCKLADFGLAARADQMCTSKAGKAYYMAPEVVAASAEAPYDPRAADVWSLGILLFVLVAGSPLVAEASADNHAYVAIARAGVREVLDAWGAATALCASAIDLLDGMLQVDPRRRLPIDGVLQHEALTGLAG